MFFQQELDSATLDFDKNLHHELGLLLRKQKRTIAIVESVTGGEIGYRLTELSKSETILVGGFVCKTPLMLIQILGVSPATIREHGEGSEEVVKEIISGLQKRIKSDIYLAITGTIAIGYKSNNEEKYKEIKLTGLPQIVRQQATRTTLMYLKQWLTSGGIT